MNHKRYFSNPGTPLRRVPNAHAELLSSLTRIVRECPPRKPWRDQFRNQLMGLFSGPTSIAYLFLWLSRLRPDLQIEGERPKAWCNAYLDCASEQLKSPSKLHGWGIMNEYLAYNAVKAAATQDTKYVERLEDAVRNEFHNCPDDANEHFSGRAGALALLRLVQHWIPSTRDRMSQCMKPIIAHIMASTPWEFRGKPYIGAAHGTIGILTQLVLCDPTLAKDPLVERLLDDLLSLQSKDGHWPPTSDVSRRSSSSDLVQFCHGSPGFVISLLKIRPHARPDLQGRIDVAVERGRAEIWQKGLLRKEPNLCHGITGNMLALEHWPQREHFMAFVTRDEIRSGIQSGRFILGDDPYGLFWGEAGRAWGWMMLETGEDLGFPGYTTE